MFLPGIEASAGERAAWALAAALVLPGFGLLGILVQNAAALLLPGWVQLGREHRQGIEAIGQRLIITAATLIVLLVAVLPAALVFGTCTLVGLPLLGPLVYPVAAAIAAVGLGLEAVLAVLWLGIRFERLDPSVEAEVLGPAG
jgi:hypothetical protein